MRAMSGLLITTALIAASGSATAQVRQGQPFSASGALEDCDCRYGNHTVRFEAGRRYRIAARSQAFDAMLRVQRAGSSEVLAADDDSGGERDPLIHFTPSETADYLVRVASFSSDGVGAYSLEIEALEALPAPMTRPTGTESQSWQVYDGSLDNSDPAEGEMRFDDYALSLGQGQSALIRLDSETFDPMIRVFKANQRGVNEVAADDDGGNGFNAFLMFAPDEPGDYIVRVTSFSTEGLGAYKLRIAR